jgi:threonine/homoserine/homoserine lactone efflux protein
VTVHVWLLFVVTETVLCLTPGPAVLAVVAQALARGAATSTWTALGILSANGLYFALSATGLGAVLLASYDAFSLVRWIGAAYLVWLGVRLLLGRGGPACAATPSPGAGRRRAFAGGFVLQAANPKALLFFVALLPQFIDPTGPLTAQIVVLGVTSVVIELIVLLAYGACAGRVRALAVRPRVARIADGVAGAMLVGAGIGLGTRTAP